MRTSSRSVMSFHCKRSELLRLKELKSFKKFLIVKSEEYSVLLMHFLGCSKADNDPQMQGIYNYVWKSNNGHGLTKSNTLNQNMAVLRRKKRKVSTFLQSPWHNVYREGSELCHNISILEQGWDLVTNALCEKNCILIDEKCDPNEVISPSKRRIFLSTNLMQQLLQPAPAFVFSGNNAAAFNYEMVLYFVSRITLADSCSLKCYSDFKKCTNHQTSKTASDKDRPYSSLVKAFMEKIQKLESDFQSLERTTSILDIILEIQDLERFSMINHLGKFHNRAKTITRPIPQRYVLEKQMPVNLPEPLNCLPL